MCLYVCICMCKTWKLMYVQWISKSEWPGFPGFKRNLVNSRIGSQSSHLHNKFSAPALTNQMSNLRFVFGTIKLNSTRINKSGQNENRFVCRYGWLRWKTIHLYRVFFSCFVFGNTCVVRIIRYSQSQSFIISFEDKRWFEDNAARGAFFASTS